MNRQGPFLFVPVEGDVAIESVVSVRMETDSSSPPDKEWQFAGLMLRDASGDRSFTLENYVFVVVGHRGTRLQLEYKSTVEGIGEVHAIDWASGDADLRLSRRGVDVEVSAREIGGAEWKTIRSFGRPDLPKSLQAGILTYAFSYGRGAFDLRADFGGFRAVRLAGR